MILNLNVNIGLETYFMNRDRILEVGQINPQRQFCDE